jgi:hypothetical protein
MLKPLHAWVAFWVAAVVLWAIGWAVTGDPLFAPRGVAEAWTAFADWALDTIRGLDG